MKKVLALILVGAASCGSDIATSSPEFNPPTTTTTTTPVTDGPKLDDLDSFWFETTDPEGVKHLCLYVGWKNSDYWSDLPDTGAMSLYCRPSSDQTTP